MHRVERHPLLLLPHLTGLPRPVIVAVFGEEHPFRLDRGGAIELFGALLDRTQGTLVVSDPGGQVPKLRHGRVRRVTHDAPPVSKIEMAGLFRQVQLVISLDDGLDNVFPDVSTPALCVWHHKKPLENAVPGPQTLNLVCGKQTDLWLAKRWGWNLVEYRDDRPSVGEIVQLVEDLLAGIDFGLPGEAIAKTVQLKHYLRRCRQRTPFAEHADRHLTFERLFREIGQRFADPVIVETGCVRALEDWSAGYSSYLFGAYLSARQSGHLHSVDCTAKNLLRAEAIVAPFADRITLHEADSVRWLQRYSGRIDVLYLDSMDVGVTGYEDHALSESQAAYDKLHSDSLILLDDTVWDEGWVGKGAKAVPWLIDQGWRILLAGYQVLLAR